MKIKKQVLVFSLFLLCSGVVKGQPIPEIAPPWDAPCFYGVLTLQARYEYFSSGFYLDIDVHWMFNGIIQTSIPSVTFQTDYWNPNSPLLLGENEIIIGDYQITNPGFPPVFIPYDTMYYTLENPFFLFFNGCLEQTGPTSYVEKICEPIVISYNYNVTSGYLNVYPSYQVGVTVIQNPEPYSLTLDWSSAFSPPNNQGGYIEFEYSYSYWFQQLACISNFNIQAEIIPKPTAQFSTDLLIENGLISICAGQSINFENTSTDAETYQWNFGDGFVSGQEDISHAFTQTGTYEVELIATASCHCIDTARVLVEVMNAYGLDCVSTVCAGDTVTYTTNADCLGLNWNVSGNGEIIEGGGNTDNSITVHWQSGSVGNIEFSPDNCTTSGFCNENVQVSIPIISGDAQIEGKTKICEGETTTYNIPSYDGSAFAWTVSNFGTIIEGQGSALIHVKWLDNLQPNQEMWVAVEYDNCYLGCGGQDTLIIVSKQDFRLEGAHRVCPDTENSRYYCKGNFDNNNISSDWTLSEGNNLIWQVNAQGFIDINWIFPSGIYTLTATPVNENYCIDEVKMTVTIVAPPPAIDSISGDIEICPGETYTYKALNTKSFTSTEWTITMGSEITYQTGNPVLVTWADSANLSLSLTQVSNDELQCVSTAFELNIQTIQNIIIAGESEVCTDTKTTVAGQNTFGGSNQWTITPESIGTIINDPEAAEIEILWHHEGTANVELFSCGVTNSFIIEVHPNPQPFVPMIPNVCVGELAAVATTNSFSTYQWINENNLVVSALENPNLGAGFYQVEVTDDFGCLGDTIFSITAYPESNINISTPSPNIFCNETPSTHLFAVNNSDEYDYQWYKDGIALGGNTPDWLAVEIGTYQVQITDVNNCLSWSNSIAVDTSCIANATGGGGTSNNPDGYPFFYISCVSITMDFDISAGATCNERNYVNLTEYFIDGTLIWNFDDVDSGVNNTSNLENPSHIYTKAGFFYVRLTADFLDDDGQIFTCDTARIDTSFLVADFSAETDCPGSMAAFTDLSTFLPFSNISAWQWDFGDPSSGIENTSTAQSPIHIYGNAGFYTVRLTVLSTNGCISTIEKNIEIRDIPDVSFDYPEGSCVNSATAFSAIVPDNVSDVRWDFGDPASGNKNQSDLLTTWHDYVLPGDYTVSLTATDIYACNNLYSLSISIVETGSPGEIALVGNNPLCEGSFIQLSAPVGGIAWFWSTGETTESILVGETGEYTLKWTDVNGCILKPEPVQIEVIPAPETLISAITTDEETNTITSYFDNLTICYGEEFTLQAAVFPNYIYSWGIFFENGPEIQFTEHANNLPFPGTYTIFLNVIDALTSCSNTIGPFVLEVSELPIAPEIAASLPGSICAGQEMVFNVVNPDDDLTYIWNTGQVGDSLTTSLGGQYFVVAINETGCRSLKSNVKEIIQGPDIGLVPSGCHSRCRTDRICLPVMDNVVEYQWYFNGNPISTEREIDILEDGEYYVEMLSDLGCTYTSDPLFVTLYDGVGSFEGEVYSDVNGNGFIDAQDTLVSGVNIQLLENGILLDNNVSDESGLYTFEGIAISDYILQIDTTSIPEFLQVILTEINTELERCEDIITINWLLTRNCIENENIESLHFSVCEGEILDFEDGIEIMADTTFFRIHSTFGECDSIEIIEVDFLTKKYNALAFETCMGSTYSYFGTELPIGTENDFIYTAANGCDSTVTVMVSAFPENTSQFAVETCEGSSYDYFGTAIDAGVESDFIFIAANGCDSVVTVMVGTLPKSEIQLSVETCEGDVYDYFGTMLEPNTEHEFIFVAANGCDSTVTLNVVGLDLPTFETEIDSNCIGTQTGQVQVTNLTGNNDFQYAINENEYQSSPIFSALADGWYAVKVLDANGCESTENIYVPAYPTLSVYTQNYMISCKYLETTIEVEILSGDDGYLEYLWGNGTSLSSLFVTKPGVYTVHVSNQCETITKQIDVTLEAGDFTDFAYIPNVFSPNGDGINEKFCVYFQPDLIIENFTFMIFDRWGNFLFETNRPTECWDAKARSQKMNSGVYVWYMKASVVSCGRRFEIEERGDVVIIK